MRPHGRLGLGAIAIGLGVLVTACGSSSATPGRSAATTGTASAAGTTSTAGTTSPPTPSIVVPAISAACPPGCQEPSDSDAITVLASSANLVAIVSVKGGSASGTRGLTFSTDMVLQGNPHGLPYAPTGQDVARLLISSGGVQGGHSFLLFVSYDRGGACLSALFGYDPGTETASLIESADGQSDQIELSGRVLAVPRTTTLAEVRARMFPTTGVVYPSDSEEWYCPGP